MAEEGGSDLMCPLRRRPPVLLGADLDHVRVLHSSHTALPRDRTRGIEVVVVAYGSDDYLDRCLTELDRQFPVTVVDNGSSSSTAATAHRHYARYVDPGTNLGFGAGVNAALAGVPLDACDVLLLNPDAEVHPRVIHRLASELDEHPDLCCVAPAQSAPGTGHADRVVWPFPTPAGLWIEALGAGSLRSASDFVIGSVVLVSGKALLDIGGFDERFFLYDEEIDWQRRATLRGWAVGYCPDVHALHIGAATDDDGSRRALRFHAGTERYLRKWFGRWGWTAARSAMVLGGVVRAIALKGDRRSDAWERARTYAAGPDRLAMRRGAVPPARPRIPVLGASDPPSLRADR